MNKMKKFLAVICAAAALLGMGAISASAATIQMGADPNDILKDHSFKAYQIFTGTQEDTTTDDAPLADIEWGSGINSTNFLIDLKDNTKFAYASIFTNCTNAEQVAEALATASPTDDTDIAKAFAHFAYNYIDTSKGITLSNPGKNASTSSTEVSAGYYLIVDSTTTVKTDGTTDEVLNAALLQVTGTVTINTKTVKPTVDKQILEDKNNTWQNAADFEKAQPVPFRIVSEIPVRITDYESYEFIFHDDMSDGLDFVDTALINEKNDDAFDSTKALKVEIKSVSREGSTVLTLSSGYDAESNPTGYTLNMGTSDDDDFDLKINDLKAVYAKAIETDRQNKLNAYKAEHGNSEDGFAYDVPRMCVVISYYGRLNSSAVIGNNGNPNEVSLEYSNNPEGEGTGTTRKVPVKAFTYEVDINKVNKSNENLKGAEFVLSSIVNNSRVYYTFDTSGNVTGTVSSKDDATKIKTTSSNGSSYVSPKMIGLDEGTYDLYEIKAPDGYKTPDDPFFIIIESKLTQGSDPNQILTDLTTSTTMLCNNTPFTVDTSNHGLGTVKIENDKGGTLPETGAMGTMMFVLFGGLATVVTAVLIITRKKMSIYDD